MKNATQRPLYHSSTTRKDVLQSTPLRTTEAHNDQSTAQVDPEGNDTINDLILTSATLTSVLTQEPGAYNLHALQYWNNLSTHTPALLYGPLYRLASAAPKHQRPSESMPAQIPVPLRLLSLPLPNTTRAPPHSGRDFVLSLRSRFFSSSTTPLPEFRLLRNGEYHPDQQDALPTGSPLPASIQVLYRHLRRPSFDLAPPCSASTSTTTARDPSPAPQPCLRYDREIGYLRHQPHANSRTHPEIRPRSKTGVATVSHHSVAAHSSWLHSSSQKKKKKKKKHEKQKKK